jgi:dTDP-4-dehydrorhamnose 3,5-epimerase/reductase
VSSPALRTTAIPGLLTLRLPVHVDSRGWFKENWHRAKMTALGLPDFHPVQHSVAYNGPAGVTRGVHAEPWDKLVSVARGSIFGAWVDLRAGPTFGAVHTEPVDEATAVFVPRGVGNAYQTLVDDTVYSYLVNAHWSPDAAYTHVDLADPALAIPWPIPLERAEISEKDRRHPPLARVGPVPPRRVLVLGAGGQVGSALSGAMRHAVGVSRDELDLADLSSIRRYDFSDVDVVLNAGAMTGVDAAESPQGRRQAWAVNATGVAELARAAVDGRFTLVHFSSDYVFDGTDATWSEGDPLAPLSAYGQSKAAGDLAVQVVPRHYLIRTSWVVGAGANFVRTMRHLARQGASPRVVDDQWGRLTFADELARATVHLLEAGAPFGTYNVTNSGEPMTWAAIARTVFEHEGRDPQDVVPVSTEDYVVSAPGQRAPRPTRSVLSLDKLARTGFVSEDQSVALRTFLGT